MGKKLSKLSTVNYVKNKFNSLVEAVFFYTAMINYQQQGVITIKSVH